MFWRKRCRIKDFDEEKVLHVVTLLESILLLFTKWRLTIGAVVRRLLWVSQYWIPFPSESLRMVDFRSVVKYRDH